MSLKNLGYFLPISTEASKRSSPMTPFQVHKRKRDVAILLASQAGMGQAAIAEAFDLGLTRVKSILFEMRATKGRGYGGKDDPARPARAHGPNPGRPSRVERLARNLAIITAAETGMTQQQISESFGVSRSSVTYIAGGLKAVRGRAAAARCEAEVPYEERDFWTRTAFLRKP